MHSKVPLAKPAGSLPCLYPGRGAVCKEIARDKNLAYKYTLKANTIAIVTDGSRVLSLGNIGGYAAIPVMEGKALLFKKLADIDAFPICFESYHTEFVDEVKNIAPVFGGIALEDIAAPKCFELEEALQGIGIPVMHDDQHGTAVVVLAALLNACKVTKKRFEDLNIVICGAGAAGFAITRILKCIGYDPDLCSSVNDIIVCDTKGIIHRDRDGLYTNKYKFIIGEETTSAGGRGRLPMRWKAQMSVSGYRCRALYAEHGSVDEHTTPLSLRWRIPSLKFSCRRPSRRRGSCRHGAQRVPQPDQLRTRVPGDLPRGARCLRHPDLGRDESRCRPCACKLRQTTEKRPDPSPGAQPGCGKDGRRRRPHSSS